MTVVVLEWTLIPSMEYEGANVTGIASNQPDYGGKVMEHGLSIELRYLIYSALLMLVLWIPYILAELQKTGLVEALSYPDERQLPLWAQRLKNAHYNLVENIVPFAVAVGAGELLNVHNEVTAACAMVFFWSRVAHPVAQVVRVWGTRTATFAIGLTATFIYLVTILISAAS